MNALATVRRCLIVIAAGLGIYLLHWGKDFLMPLVLSLLLADVLMPAVRYLKRWHSIPHGRHHRHRHRRRHRSRRHPADLRPGDRTDHPTARLP